ncbi:hypothetical protein ACL02O_29915 [Micromonospora sp. MS34]|uniref:hypothetical protein n=1 Tax=Micromonospora sp. MS34 TaxID=3385971 RepID=UPI00399FD04A
MGRRNTRNEQPARRWPKLDAASGTILVLATLGAVGVGLASGDKLLRTLFELACTPDHCQPVGLVAAGWLPLGGGMVLAGLIYRKARPGMPALWALGGCLVLASFGLAALFGGGNLVQQQPPHAGMLLAGAGAGLLPLLVVGRPAEPRRRGRGPVDPGRPLLLVNIGQAGALLVVLIWAALLG